MPAARKFAPSSGPFRAQRDTTERSPLLNRVSRKVASPLVGVAKLSSTHGGRVKKRSHLPVTARSGAIAASPLHSDTTTDSRTPSSDMYAEKAEANKNHLATMVADFEASRDSAGSTSYSDEAKPTTQDKPKSLEEKLPPLPPAPRGEPPLPQGVQRRLYTVKKPRSAEDVMRSSRFCHHIRMIVADHIQQGRSRESILTAMMHSLRTLMAWDAQQQTARAAGKGKAKAKVKNEEVVSVADGPSPTTEMEGRKAESVCVPVEAMSEGEEIAVASAVKREPQATPAMGDEAEMEGQGAGGEEQAQIVEEHGRADVTMSGYVLVEKGPQQHEEGTAAMY